MRNWYIARHALRRVAQAVPEAVEGEDDQGPAIPLSYLTEKVKR
jgi:hypothetical protein